MAVETLFDYSKNSFARSEQNDVSSFASKKSNSHVYITIQPDQGGLEARDFCTIFLRMLEKYFVSLKLNYDIINQTDFEIVVRLEDNPETWQWLSGYHKIVRVSPFSKGDKIHTSLCRVVVSNPIKKMKIEIQEKDLRMDFFVSTGPGGQHRNKTMSAVRLTHIPTNTVTVSCAERSQHNNRAYAMEQLLEKLEKLEHKVNADLNAKRREEALGKKQAILTFYYNHKMVVNERAGIKSTRLKEILNGDLDLIKA